MKLLCISNGHGEDVIALQILNALHRYAPDLQISALPISGTGRAYSANGISLVGPTQALPSGGFLNRDPKQLARDVRKGLLPLTRQQLQSVKRWATQAHREGSILAVGDIVPLLFSRLSKQPYHFIGTAKSEYWLRDEQGKRPPTTLSDRLEGWSGSVYLPWERWLMASARCRSLFVRDALTAQHLQKLGIPADYAGNPMMDNLAPTGQLTTALSSLRLLSALTIALLPGSRPPEAYENWTRIVAAIPSLVTHFPHRSVILLAAIAPSLSLQVLQSPLQEHFQGQWEKPTSEMPYSTFTYENVTLVLVNNAYSDCLHQADIAIATAGTATEQFVGLGKPSITLPGNGPQFTPAFAKVQSRMLGPSIQVLTDPTQTGNAISKLLNDPAQLKLIHQNGTHRMGSPGAGDRIARKLLEVMNNER
ncbi:MAG: lipid-A-disaccharide synthase-related protein [Cyanobacteria bacterium P01_D01_bin.105]